MSDELKKGLDRVERQPPRSAFVMRRAWLLFACAMVSLLTDVVAAEPPKDTELSGTNVHYEYDGRADGHAERAWLGRAYVPKRTAAAGKAVPLVVFLHGLNSGLIKYRWMGGGNEGDVRRIVGDMVDQKLIEPVVIAGPSSIVASQVSHGSSWNNFDLDGFVARTREALKGVVDIDEKRIIVAGHSGAGCSMSGGLARLGSSKLALLGVLSIDTCMIPAIATRLAELGELTHVVVSYQKSSWAKRPFAAFIKAFEAGVAEHPSSAGVLREVEEQHPKRAPHDATVELTFHRWLPKLLRPAN